MDARDLPRYKRLLLTKLEELSASRGKVKTVVPGAGDRQGDFAEQANSDTEAELQIRLHQTDGRLPCDRGGISSREATHVWRLCNLREPYFQGSVKRSALDASVSQL